MTPGKQARSADDDVTRKNETATSQEKSAKEPVEQNAPANSNGAAAKASANSNRESKRIDQASLAKLVAEENANKSKFPEYPGLDRWELVEKMGDGAFSNVYRARDLQGKYDQVAIKVVRKYEMNSMQVCEQPTPAVHVANSFLFSCISLCFSVYFSCAHSFLPRVLFFEVSNLAQT